MAPHYPHGVGLGFRRELLNDLELRVPSAIDFFEISPENWMDLGGALGRRLRPFTERYPFVCHGLSLSLGGPAALNEALLHKISAFMDMHGVALFTEHLSYCGDDGHLYDQLPIPFTSEAVTYVAARIRRTQDILERKIAIENSAFYVMADIAKMDEASFINAVLEEADCLLHLDVNNVYINSINHQYDASAFIRAMPAQRVVYMHTAGHSQEAPDLLVDTHAADVVEPVWALLDEAYHHIGVVPTLLERDSNIPPLDQLVGEVERIADFQRRHLRLHERYQSA